MQNRSDTSHYHSYMAFRDYSSILLGFQVGVLVWNGFPSLSNNIKLPLVATTFLGATLSSVLIHCFTDIYTYQGNVAEYQKNIFSFASALLFSLRAWQRYPLDSGFYALCWGVQYLEKSSSFWINIDDYYRSEKATNIKIPILSLGFWLYSFMDKDFSLLKPVIDLIPKNFSYVTPPLTCCYIFYSIYNNYINCDIYSKPFIEKTEDEIKKRTTFGFVKDKIKEFVSFDNNRLFFKACFYSIPEAFFSLSQIPFSDFKVKFNVIYPIIGFFKVVSEKKENLMRKDEKNIEQNQDEQGAGKVIQI